MLSSFFCICWQWLFWGLFFWALRALKSKDERAKMKTCANERNASKKMNKTFYFEYDMKNGELLEHS